MKGYNFGRRLLEINGMAKLLILKLQQNLTRYKAFHCVINFRRKRKCAKKKRRGKSPDIQNKMLRLECLKPTLIFI